MKNLRSIVLLTIGIAGLLVAYISSALESGDIKHNWRVVEGTSISEQVDTILAEQSNSSTDAHWIGYEVPMVDGSTGSCCFGGASNNQCDLSAKSYNSYHGSSEMPISERLQVYVKLLGGEIKTLRNFADSCAVISSIDDVTWINDVSETESLDFLSDLVERQQRTTGKNAASGALAALAQQQGEAVTKRLIRYANVAERSKFRLRHEAIFWLGSARGDSGYQALIPIVRDSASKDVRAHALFAISQNAHSEVVDLIVERSKIDPSRQVRQQAFLWLKEVDEELAIRELKALFEDQSQDKLQQQVLFLLGDFDSEAGMELLEQLATDSSNSRLQGEAIFWMAQESHPNTRQLIMGIVNNPENGYQLKDRAVFAMSQLDSGAVDGLIDILKTADDVKVKKQAMFWLAESDDPRATQLLEQVLFN